MIELLIAAIVALQVWPIVHPAAVAGTYQTVAQADGSLLRMDTRTGALEHCALKDNAINCVPVVPQRSLK